MEWIVGVLLMLLLAYLVYDEVRPTTIQEQRGTLLNSIAAGSTDPQALKRGIRLLEVDLYSDDDDNPVVGDDKKSFESVCVDIVNDAFPSEYPCILSIVSYTEKNRTLNLAAEHIKTTLRKHLVSFKGEVNIPLESLQNKLVIVSGGDIVGTELDTLTNLSWNDSNVRRLTYTQAVHPDDPMELSNFTKSGIVLVEDSKGYVPPTEHPETPLKYGCQWNFYLRGPGGFSTR